MGWKPGEDHVASLSFLHRVNKGVILHSLRGGQVVFVRPRTTYLRVGFGNRMVDIGNGYQIFPS